MTRIGTKLERWTRVVLVGAPGFIFAAGPPPTRAASNPPGTDAYRRFALIHEGDPRRGKDLFADEQMVACSRCHTVDGKGGKAGPDLFAVGDKFGRREIIESVLLPSASIAVGYSTTTLATKSGEEFQGIVKQVTDAAIELVGADARPVRIATADIAARRTSEVSLMPEGLHVGLTLEAFTDLIEYLVSLKQPESAAMVEHGMPGVIQPLARPVALRPFIAEEFKFEHPVWFGPVPGEANAFLVVEHETGRIWRLEMGRAAPSAPDAKRAPVIENTGIALTGPSDTLSPPKNRGEKPPDIVRASAHEPQPAAGTHSAASHSQEKKSQGRSGTRSYPVHGEGRDEGCSKTLFVDTGVYDQGTRGLLGLALHPRFRENGRYYFAKHVAEAGKFATIIFEREAAPDLKTDSGKPSRLQLRFDEATNVHYGGGLEFGPDGYFYIGMGDSGPQEDPQGHGQNVKLFLGKMLRVDVDHVAGGQPYAVPRDNPFLGRPEFRPEIWAYGFREPWRFSFDPVTGDLWVGDVGQDRYEEVDIVRRGENHGWNVYEGFEPFSNRYRRPGETCVPPVFAYSRKYGPSVTGGYVYRAQPTSAFYGVYVFGDYESRRLFGLTQTNRVLKMVRQIGVAPQRIVSFGRDAQGELYFVGYEGMIYKLDFDGAVFE